MKPGTIIAALVAVGALVLIVRSRPAPRLPQTTLPPAAAPAGSTGATVATGLSFLNNLGLSAGLWGK